jgi:hypothetical protein
VTTRAGRDIADRSKGYLNSFRLSTDVVELDVLLGEVHLVGEGRVRLPLARGAGSGLLQHLVDLLKGKTLGLRDEEVGEEEGDAAKTTPHEEHIGAHVGRVGLVGDEVRGDDSDDAVPEPDCAVSDVYTDLDAKVLTSWTRWRDRHHGIGW